MAGRVSYRFGFKSSPSGADYPTKASRLSGLCRLGFSLDISISIKTLKFLRFVAPPISGFLHLFQGNLNLAEGLACVSTLRFEFI